MILRSNNLQSKIFINKIKLFVNRVLKTVMSINTVGRLLISVNLWHANAHYITTPKTAVKLLLCYIYQKYRYNSLKSVPISIFRGYTWSRIYTAWNGFRGSEQRWSVLQYGEQFLWGKVEGARYAFTMRKKNWGARVWKIWQHYLNTH